jgi:tRNA U34 5-methylaminomethyl-2-thiouridine-forming methyltransferase MnmC
LADQQAQIEWRDGGVPVSTRFDDPYFSLDGGLAETRHVFLDGNGLPDRFRPGFTIAELGVGTGLNLAAAILAWRATGQIGTLRYVGFEAYPMTPDDIAHALGAFPEIAPATSLVQAAFTAAPDPYLTDDLSLHVVIGDANDTLPDWDGKADAWFLDGFAPARNPELWQPDLLAEVARHTAPGGTAASYTAAGHVRRALADAGFVVDRRPGFGRKRHMTVARLPE